jgi:hypothetical protein
MPKHQDLDESVRVMIDGHSGMKASGRNGGHSSRTHPYKHRLRNETVSCGGFGEKIRQICQKRSLQKFYLWFRVTIGHGGGYTKDYNLKTLMASVAPTVFLPLRYQVAETNSSFFVDHFIVAEKLASVRNRIRTCNGLKLLLNMRPGLPYMVINYTVKGKIKTVMAKRYNVDLKTLDVTTFYKDADLTGIAVALFKPGLMLVALEIIEENFPDLEVLDLMDKNSTLLTASVSFHETSPAQSS